MIRQIHRRAPTRVEDEIARHLEQEVADEENSCTPAKDFRAEAQVLVHGETGKADVHPVEKRDGVQRHHEGDEAASHLGEDLIVLLHRPARAPCRTVI